MADNGTKWQIEYLGKADFETLAGDPHQWFADQGQKHGLSYFLAHADDGVIWGEVRNGQLALSGDAFPEVAVKLRTDTLQQARLFSQAGELLVWRGQQEGEWHGRYLTDGSVTQDDTVEETHRLWGTASDPPGPKASFTLMQDGVQGLFHAPPLTLAKDERAELKVRHYLDYDEQGQAYIALSRLLQVK